MCVLWFTIVMADIDKALLRTENAVDIAITVSLHICNVLQITYDTLYITMSIAHE